MSRKGLVQINVNNLKFNTIIFCSSNFNLGTYTYYLCVTIPHYLFLIFSNDFNMCNSVRKYRIFQSEIGTFSFVLYLMLYKKI